MNMLKVTHKLEHKFILNTRSTSSRMKTLLLSLLCLFVWSQSTEALTDQQVVLGQRVTVACEYRLKAVIWFVMKLPARPEMILRTFGSEKAEYYDEKLRKKYTEGARSHLVINNVSDDDLGIYYCIQPGFALSISDGIRLHTTEMPQDDGSHTGPHNTEDKTTESPQSTPNEPEQENPAQHQSILQISTIMFSLLTVVLFAVVIGLLMMNHKRCKKIPEYANSHQISAIRFRESKVKGKPEPEYLEVLPNI